jgi:HlyD family secretion protein
VKKVAFGSNSSQATGSSSSSGGGGSSAGTSTGVVTYSTELEVANEDLSLRPGMTATVDIAIMDKENVLVVPNAALRFDPAAAAAVGQPEEPNRTLVQSLAPTGRRWRGNQGPRPGGPGRQPQVFVLRDGEPVAVPVKTGITDGRVTEITGGDLGPDTPVVVSIKPKTPA